MIFGIALLVTIISIIGCINVKKSSVRFVLGIMAAFCLMIVVLTGSFTYVTRYKENEVASSKSPDGKYELFFQQIGDPDWPFGHTHARLVLKDESGTIAKYSFDVANDGANILSHNWQVTWKEDCVEAVISGEEQNDNQYILYFSGKTNFNQLDSKYGKTAEEERLEYLKKMEKKGNLQATIDNIEEDKETDIEQELLENNRYLKLKEDYEIQIDENGYPISEDYQEYKRELLEIAKEVGVDSDLEIKCYLSAKGYPYAVISCSIDNATGERRENHLLLNETYDNPSEHEYVLEEYWYGPEGEELASPTIVDFYLIDCETMAVTDEHTNAWH